MSKNDWYRRTTWDQADEDDFMARLNRARTDFNKAQYLRIQALYLQTEADPPLYEKSIKLLDLLFEKYPQSYEVASALLQKAQCLENLGRIKQATDAYIRSVEMDQKTSNINTRAPLEFARFVVKQRLKKHYKRAAKTLRDSKMLMLFPESVYLANSAMAIISEEQGNRRKAQKYASLALNALSVKDSGLHMRPEVGLVKDPDKEILERLKSIIGS
jgi:tetratricopeptide (TPR) repeat protein